jgi:hypothetical protein
MPFFTIPFFREGAGVEVGALTGLSGFEEDAISEASPRIATAHSSDRVDHVLELIISHSREDG